MTIAARYVRNIEALSERECAILSDRTVAVIGCGGLGGYVIETLARVGVGAGAGRLIVVDGDVFDESNLNRQLLSTEALVGTSKAQAAQTRVKAINSEVHVTAVETYLDEGNAMSIVGDCDCVVDALDNVTARLVLAHACSNAGIPLIYGAIAGWYGQVSVVCPGDLSYAVLYGAKDDPTEHGVERKLGNLPFTAAATAAIQASQCVHVLLGHEDALLRNCILAIDLMSASAETIELA